MVNIRRAKDGCRLLHSYFVPGLVYSNSVSSTALNQTTGSDWNSTSFIAGNVTLVKEWRHSDLSVNYTGGGFFSTAGNDGSGNGSGNGSIGSQTKANNNRRERKTGKDKEKESEKQGRKIAEKH